MLTEKGTGRAPGSTYWFIAKNENGRVEVLTVDLGEGEQALPVFGYEEEAEMFLCLGGAGDGWRARESTPRELVSVLDDWPTAGQRQAYTNHSGTLWISESGLAFSRVTPLPPE